MKVARWVALALLLFSLAVAAGIGAISQGWFGRDEVQGVIAGKAVPRGEIARRTATVREAALVRGVAEPKQVLFGDLHVHTTFSVDAFLMSLPIAGGSGAHPPADACDFARYCSALDFWSINDHAENLSPRMWSETVAAVRQCNAIAGDAESPDLVTYLGWEWSQIGFTPDTHYGHKNVVLRDLADDAITARPIGARAPFSDRRRFFSPFTEIAISLLNGRRGLDFARFLAEVQSLTSCPEGVPVRDLPSDCQELTATPADLFAKLREWDVPAIVIPHGNTWGIYTPPGASFRKQLAGNDPDLQRLVEVYSGHGNAEEYRDWRATVIGADGSASCPAPGGGFRPSCWRAGELIRERCLAEGSAEEACDARAAVARQNYVDAGIAGWRTVPGQPASGWLDSGQCRDCFLPAFNYRPASSVQAMLAYRSFDSAGRPRRFRFGLIGSSDIHTARPGTGYKEFGRGAMTEGGSRRPGREPPAFLLGTGEATSSVSVPLDLDDNPYRGLQLFEGERATAFFNTGGLVAVHAPGRDRNAIFAALENREAYATSGPRILLWFDLLGDAGGPGVPMGAATVRVAPPHFRVRAVGSFEQKPGCPEIAGRALGAERLAELCLGECYHPSDERRLITRIEVVRIRPQVANDEPLTGLVEDPWRSFDCPPDPAGCSVEFDDPDFASASRDAVYYARAIEAPSLAIHGDPLNCTVDAAGECVKVELCDLHTSYQNDCLGEVEERAWSSPIFVDYGGVPAPSSYAAVNPENARPPFDPKR